MSRALVHKQPATRGLPSILEVFAITVQYAPDAVKDAKTRGVDSKPGRSSSQV
jgi:hypothetical protein